MYGGPFKRERISYAGYAVVTDSDAPESGPTPEKSTDQLVDPMDLTAVLVPVPGGKSGIFIKIPNMPSPSSMPTWYGRKIPLTAAGIP